MKEPCLESVGNHRECNAVAEDHEGYKDDFLVVEAEGLADIDCGGQHHENEPQKWNGEILMTAHWRPQKNQERHQGQRKTEATANTLRSQETNHHSGICPHREIRRERGRE